MPTPAVILDAREGKITMLYDVSRGEASTEFNTDFLIFLQKSELESLNTNEQLYLSQNLKRAWRFNICSTLCLCSKEKGSLKPIKTKLKNIASQKNFKIDFLSHSNEKDQYLQKRGESEISLLLNGLRTNSPTPSLGNTIAGESSLAPKSKTRAGVQKIGGSLPTVQKHEIPLQKSTFKAFKFPSDHVLKITSPYSSIGKTMPFLQQSINIPGNPKLKSTVSLVVLSPNQVTPQINCN